MNLIHREPMREVDEFFARLAPLGFGRWPRVLGEDAGKALEWSPAADVTETESEYLVKAELPGVKREDVKVTVEAGILTIQGERRQEKEEKTQKRHRIERSYGCFQRSFSLPQDAAVSDIHADCKDGVLAVHIPKAKVAKPKSVQIKVE
jgi:HSP20 family protein